jgi:nitrogen regulatory protein P-II 1
MKEIKAIIRPNRLTDVREALRHVPGFPGMTVSKVEGCSSPTRNPPMNHKEELLDYSPKVRVEIVVEDEFVDPLKAAIVRAGTTRHVGDGVVWVTQVESVDYLWKPAGQ